MGLMPDVKETKYTSAWPPSRTIPQRFLVVAGGAVTERHYFKRLESIYDIVIDYQQKNRSSEQLAEFAVSLKEEDKHDTSTDCYEQIWLVVDADDFHDHGKASKICNDNGIELIISNPCFEVWLLDYVKACPSSYTLTPDVESAAAEAKVVGGNRNKYINTELIDKEHLDAAIRNAARHNTTENRQERNRLAPNHEQEYAPWTDMPKVIETLKSNKQS